MPSLPLEHPSTAATYVITRQVFLRGLGLVYLIAFLSLWVQIGGLIGARGLLPVSEYLSFIQKLDPHPYRHHPTLLWLSSGNAMLHALCAAGVVLSLLVMAGIGQALALALLWVSYLSLVIGGQDFLSFQWDSLLLETGLLAIFFAPLQLGPRASRHPKPSKVVLWLIWWVLFRLMFESGLVKLTYGDTSWHDGTAMYFHYLSQPLPTWTSWYAYQMPGWFQRFSAYSMFAIELGAPVAIFLGRRCRRAAFVALVFLQVLIGTTGNYGFFNLLTLVLCTLLLDDAVWRGFGRWVVARWRRVTKQTPSAKTESAPVVSPPPARLQWPVWITAPLAVVLVSVTLLEAAADVTPAMRQYDWPEFVTSVREWASPFRSANSYGLFRVMTKGRPEVVIEGSSDGWTWQPYEFKWKPGDRHRRPGFCTPHMPRLDWQIWFPFLGGPGGPRWLEHLVTALLKGTPEVVGLLDDGPFGDRPPEYVRIAMYEYRFTTPAERSSTGDWWHRDRTGNSSTFTLDPATGKLAIVSSPR